MGIQRQRPFSEVQSRELVLVRLRPYALDNVD
jgi:hypothetical protein